MSAAKAKATGNSKALPDSAAGTAQGIEIVLNRLEVPLEKLKLDDLAGEMVRLEVETENRTSLRDITLRQGSGMVASAARGAIGPDNSVRLSELEWDMPRPPKSFKGQTRQAPGGRLDGSLYLNDMTLASLSTDSARAKFR